MRAAALTGTVDSRTESIWFRRYATTGPPRKRLLVLPHAGGAASFFHSWGHAFGDDVEVLVVRYPGRQERIAEPCIDAMDPLAEAITTELLPYLDVPLAIFGHSMGATVAYEVALRLERQHGVIPAGLFVSCQKPPHRQKPRTIHLDGDEGVLAEIRRLGGTDSALLEDPDLRELILPAVRADFTVVGTYGPRPAHPLRCRVVGYVGDRDPGVTASEMEAWAAVAPAGSEVHVLPGGHFYLNAERDRLIRDLTARMA